jgi:dTDP-4-amino-4,6-dideoxygalactose transaminase
LIQFNISFLSGLEHKYIQEAINSRNISGDGQFTKQCTKWLSKKLNNSDVLLTHSATAALEMAAMLAELQPGDEVIMPSYTFVSTANAVVLRGATPVFIDIRPDTLNIDELLIEQAITSKTKAIVAVHYAGIACEMDFIIDIAKHYGLIVIEDAAQAAMSSYKGKALGTIGDMAALSFHATKNISCGEGGAFITRNPEIAARAEIIREKGTNRSKFFRGEVDKYTWVSTGSSYLPSELNAAYLAAQLTQANAITERRKNIWDKYQSAFKFCEDGEQLICPTIPKDCIHNGHIYYLLLKNLDIRTKFIEKMKEAGVGCAFHYVPLHSAPNALINARTATDMNITNRVSDCIVRLPIYPDMESKVDFVIETATSAIKKLVR